MPRRRVSKRSTNNASCATIGMVVAQRPVVRAAAKWADAKKPYNAASMSLRASAPRRRTRPLPRWTGSPSISTAFPTVSPVLASVPSGSSRTLLAPATRGDSLPGARPPIVRTTRLPSSRKARSTA